MSRYQAVVFLGFACIYLQILSCQAAAFGANTEQFIVYDTSSSTSECSTGSLLPCSYKGESIRHEESFSLSDCAVCTCDNSTLICNIENCPDVACSDGQDPVMKDNECCESCPDPSTTQELTPENYMESCLYNGEVRFDVGSDYIVDDCVTCSCVADRDMRCEIRSCPATFCHPGPSYQLLNLEGECCDLCPYYLPISEVKIQPPKPFNIVSGEQNTLALNLTIRVNGGGPRVIAGDGLLKVSAFTGKFAGDRGDRFGRVEQILTDEQANRDIINTGPFYLSSDFEYRIDGIEFNFDASDLTCSEMGYLCVEVAKGNNPIMKDPRLPYIVEGVSKGNNEKKQPSNLVACTSFRSCKALATDTNSDGCTFKGTFIPIGGELVLDRCASCFCQTNHDVSCEIRSCIIPLCDEPILFEGECCEVCPYWIPIWKVQPLEPPSITAGKPNDVIFDLTIQVSYPRTRAISGDGLIKASAWASSNADGSGIRVGYNSQVLSDAQADQDFSDVSMITTHFSGFEHRIDGIEFTLDASNATCSQMQYLCVEIAKGDNAAMPDPRIPLIVEGTAGESNYTKVPSNLVGCTALPDCQVDEATTCTGSQVSFSVVKRTGQIASEPDTILGWTDVFNNVGGAFDLETGVFTAPDKGSYFFIYMFTTCIPPNAQSPQVALIKNDEAVLASSAYSNQIILDLEEGDIVWLQVQGELVATSERFSSFSGFLIE